MATKNNNEGLKNKKEQGELKDPKGKDISKGKKEEGVSKGKKVQDVLKDEKEEGGAKNEKEEGVSKNKNEQPIARTKAEQNALEEILMKACTHFEKKKSTKPRLVKSLHEFMVAYNLKHKKSERFSLEGISGSSISRALGTKGKAPRDTTQSNLDRAFELYLDKYDEETKVGFTEETILSLCIHANCLCNKPGCLTFTCDKDPLDPGRFRLLGVACQMKKVKYTDQLKTAEILPLNNIENGIWLCAFCNVDVQNHPETYTEAILREWKDLYQGYLRGGKLHFPRSSSFTRPAAEVQLCEMIIAQIGNINLQETGDIKAFLFFLTEASKSTHSRTSVYAIIQLMSRACKHYLSAVKGLSDARLLAANNAAFNKMIGLGMFHIVDIYRIRITGKPKKLVPVLKRN